MLQAKRWRSRRSPKAEDHRTEISPALLMTANAVDAHRKDRQIRRNDRPNRPITTVVTTGTAVPPKNGIRQPDIVEALAASRQSHRDHCPE